MRRLAIIAKPVPGTRGRAAVAAIAALLGQRGIAVDIGWTEAPGDATRLCREAIQSGVEMIVVHGGDGTANEAVQPLVRGAIPLAVWPGGTANALALELSLPRDVERVADMIVHGVVRRVSVGRAGTRYFLLMAGVGLDAALIRAMSPKAKRLFGRGGYWLSGLQHLLFAWHPRPFVVDLEGAEHTATFAVIANAANYGSGLRFTPRASMESDQLDVCLFDWHGRLGFLRHIPAVVAGRHLSLPGVTYRKARRVRVRGDDQTWVHVDGELLGPLPMAFESVPDALSIVVPR